MVTDCCYEYITCRYLGQALTQMLPVESPGGSFKFRATAWGCYSNTGLRAGSCSMVWFLWWWGGCLERGSCMSSWDAGRWDCCENKHCKTKMGHGVLQCFEEMVNEHTAVHCSMLTVYHFTVFKQYKSPLSSTCNMFLNFETILCSSWWALLQISSCSQPDNIFVSLSSSNKMKLVLNITRCKQTVSRPFSLLIFLCLSFISACINMTVLSAFMKKLITFILQLNLKKKKRVTQYKIQWGKTNLCRKYFSIVWEKGQILAFKSKSEAGKSTLLCHAREFSLEMRIYGVYCCFQ